MLIFYNVFVIDLLTPLVQASNEGFISGNTYVHLSCYAQGVTSLVIYEWFKWVDYFQWELVGTTQTISFHNFEKNDSGIYVCRIKDGPLKKLSRNVKIVVACMLLLIICLMWIYDRPIKTGHSQRRAFYIKIHFRNYSDFSSISSF